ncbi:hypothetical protein DSLASN_10890 [Desulfoluna limicola]|uniref:Uncharacterized protein n=1 Tax=Desulfoluna limicola TaxID=2810562 RepID=A0ABN6EYR9_9BACT|nr:hypothetical protein [Desulfoluna limicola]BCS95457.1 hypothetical protein DSLASN_10890 [Desulfoluna limicola]
MTKKEQKPQKNERPVIHDPQPLIEKQERVTPWPDPKPDKEKK